MVAEQVELYESITGEHRQLAAPSSARRAEAGDVVPFRPPDRMRVAVLKGGRGLERQVSLRSGARVEDALTSLGHEVIAIDVGADLVAT